MGQKTLVCYFESKKTRVLFESNTFPPSPTPLWLSPRGRVEAQFGWYLGGWGYGASNFKRNCIFVRRFAEISSFKILGGVLGRQSVWCSIPPRDDYSRTYSRAFPRSRPTPHSGGSTPVIYESESLSCRGIGVVRGLWISFDTRTGSHSGARHSMDWKS